MRESRTFGSVGGEGGNVLAYPATWPAMPRERAQAARTARPKVIIFALSLVPINLQFRQFVRAQAATMVLPLQMFSG